jgi:hypothetical protein
MLTYYLPPEIAAAARMPSVRESGIHQGAKTHIHGIVVRPVTLSRMRATARKSKSPAEITVCFVAMLPPVVVDIVYHR